MAMHTAVSVLKLGKTLVTTMMITCDSSKNYGDDNGDGNDDDYDHGKW